MGKSFGAGKAGLIYAVLILSIYSPVSFFGHSLQPGVIYPLGLTDQGPWDYTERKAVNSFNVDLADAAYTLFPINRLVGRLLSDGELPLWNPFQGAGEPLAAQYSTRVFFPYQMLENLSPIWSWDYFILGRLWFAALFTFLFLRRRDLPSMAAFLGGLFYSLSGGFTWFLQLEQMANVAMTLPLLMMTADAVARGGSSRAVAGLAATTALILLAGQPETAIYVLLFSGIFFLMETGACRRKEFLSSIGRYAAGSVLGIAIAAPLLLVFFFHLQHSYHLHPLGGDMGVRDHIPWSWMAAQIFPNLYSLPRPFTVTPLNGLWDYVGGYIGFGAFMLVLHQAFYARAPWKRSLLFFGGVWLFLLLKHLGIPPFIWIGYLPLLDQVWSQRWAAPVGAFAFAVALSYALAAVKEWWGAERMDIHYYTVNPVWLSSFLLALLVLSVLGIAIKVNHSAFTVLLPVVFHAIFAIVIATVLFGVYRNEFLWRKLYTTRDPETWIRRIALVLLLVNLLTLDYLRLDHQDSISRGIYVLPGEVAMKIGVAVISTVVLLLACTVPARFLDYSHRVFRVLQEKFPIILGMSIAIVLLFVVALLYPQVHLAQRGYLLPTVAGGALIDLVTGAIVVWALLRRRPAMAVIAVAIGVELVYSIPRGFAPITEWQELAVAMVGLVAAVICFRWLRCGIGLAVASLIMLTVVDLGAKQGLPRRQNPFAEIPYVAFLQSATLAHERVMGMGGVLMPTYAGAVGLQDVHYIQAVSVIWYQEFVDKYLQEAASLSGNSLWFTGYPVRHFDDLVPSKTLWFHDFASQFDDSTYSKELAVRRVVHDVHNRESLYSFLGVRFFALPSGASFGSRSKFFSETGEGKQNFPVVYDGEVRIFENTRAFPRAFLVRDLQYAKDWQAAQKQAFSGEFDLRRTAVIEDSTIVSSIDASLSVCTAADKVRIVSYKANEVRLEVDTRCPGMLVLTDTFYPGWQATIDGDSTKVLRINGLVRGIWIDQGRYVVRYHFTPPGFRVGLWLAGASCLMCIGLLTVGARRRRQFRLDSAGRN